MAISGMFSGVVFVSTILLLAWIAIRFILDRMNGLDTDSYPPSAPPSPFDFCHDGVIKNNLHLTP